MDRKDPGGPPPAKAQASFSAVPEGQGANGEAQGAALEGASTDLSRLFTALSKAQSEIGAAKKDKTNPHYKSRYADMASVVEAAREALAKHGLAVIQRHRPVGDGRLGVETILCHSSGEWIKGFLVVPVDAGRGSGAQAVGSANTYACRYALQSMLRIPGEDDDGNAAGPQRQAPSRREPEPAVGMKESPF